MLKQVDCKSGKHIEIEKNELLICLITFIFFPVWEMWCNLLYSNLKTRDKTHKHTTSKHTLKYKIIQNES